MSDANLILIPLQVTAVPHPQEYKDTYYVSLAFMYFRMSFCYHYTLKEKLTG